MTTELFTPAELADMVDTLAQIKAEIAELQNRADTYKAALIAAEVDSVNGTKHSVTITGPTYPVRIDWQAIARASIDPELLNDMIEDFSTTADEPTYTLRLTARKVAK